MNPLERRLLHRSAEDVNRIVHGATIGNPVPASMNMNTNTNGPLTPLSMLGGPNLGFEDRRPMRGMDDRRYNSGVIRDSEMSSSLYSWSPVPNAVEPAAPLLNYDAAKNLLSAGIIGERTGSNE